ncbi:hypothetical protein RN001_009547 [Aquatica leii]|uniref:K Homology domain-containing protein n=1 Tax=Aquatica leii TaxID=1421715 RepID=A0AAN7P8W5_9COLE|nr:hypothetical protein RN001_009547 [Aquatica leii]
MSDDWDESPVDLTNHFSNNIKYNRGGGERSSNNWRNPQNDNGNYDRGSKINDLQCETGAKIMVLTETVDDNTTVKINGLKDEINKAKEWMEQLTIERVPRQDKQFFNQALIVHNDLPEVIDWKALSEECDRYSKEK